MTTAGGAEARRPANAARTAIALTNLRDVRQRRRLSEVRRLVPLIIGAAAATMGDVTADLPIARIELTSTDVAIVVLGAGQEPARAVIKLPMTPEVAPALRRETRALGALHADDRLGDWRKLIPCPRAFGSVSGRPYRVDSALAGCNISPRRRDSGAWEALLTEAAATVHDLHRRTSVDLKADDELVERWIDRHVRDLVANSRLPPRAIERLRRMQAELHSAVEGRTFRASRVHGDYWLGNILFSGDRPRGVVDWDAA